MVYNEQIINICLDSLLLATCSEDGSIRLWGQRSHNPGEQLVVKASMGLSPIERFLDIKSVTIYSKYMSILTIKFYNIRPVI